MTDENRPPLHWTVQFVEPGSTDDEGGMTPGWYAVAFEPDAEYSAAALYVANHQSGSFAQASLAAVTADLLNTYERTRGGKTS